MVDEYHKGKDRLFGFFIGQVMKVIQGQSESNVVNKLLTEKFKKI